MCCVPSLSLSLDEELCVLEEEEEEEHKTIIRL